MLLGVGVKEEKVTVGVTDTLGVVIKVPETSTPL
jgi:hypothetical protein